MSLPLEKTRSRPLQRRQRRLECPEHLGDIVAFGCAVPGCMGTDIEIHHPRGLKSTAAAGRRSGDDEASGLCFPHHRGPKGVHALGERKFAQTYGVDLDANGAWLWGLRLAHGRARP